MTLPNDTQGAPVAEAPDLPGYDLLELLGEGGNAAVWLVRHQTSEALCVLKAQRRQRDRKGVKRNRFMREARVTRMLDHPNIARTYDFGEINTGLYMTMELVHGVELKSFAEKCLDGRLGLEMTSAIILDILEALEYAHTRSDARGTHLEIVHRDITPRNVMVTFDGTAKLIDFGLVRSTKDAFRTDANTICGTPLYMSPEQACAEQVDARSDLYSTGVVMYELLTGEDLVQGEAIDELLMSIVAGEPKPPSHYTDDIPPPIDALLIKALAKEREDRFQTAKEFKAALIEALGDVRPADRPQRTAALETLMADEAKHALRLRSHGRIDHDVLVKEAGPRSEDTIEEKLPTGEDLKTEKSEHVPALRRWAAALGLRNSTD